MAVLQTTLWQAAPGRGAEVVAAMATAKRIHQRLGAKALGAQIQVGGTNSGRFVYALYFPDLSAYASLTQALAGDMEWQMYVRTVLQSAAPAATLLSNTIGSEIPGFEVPFDSNGKSVSVVRQMRAGPGARQAAVELLGGMKPIIERLGGTTRLTAATFAGDAHGTITVVSRFPDIASWAKAMDSLPTDAEYGALTARIYAADSPCTTIALSVAGEIPI